MKLRGLFVCATPRRTAVPAGINEYHVDQLNQVVEFFQHSDMLFGGGMSRNAVAGQLEWSCDILAKASMSDAVRRSWQSATARLADVAGFHVARLWRPARRRGR